MEAKGVLKFVNQQTENTITCLQTMLFNGNKLKKQIRKKDRRIRMIRGKIRFLVSLYLMEGKGHHRRRRIWQMVK